MTFSFIGVLMVPGEIELTRTLCGPNSTAIWRVIAITAPLAPA
jgi:hypothetical protein